jgi:hypothetical protein
MPKEESIEGMVIDVRGPLFDGSYELDIKKEDGEVVTVAISAEQYVELMKNADDEGEYDVPPVPKHLLN